VARKRYTDNDRANALALLAISSTEEVAKETGIPVRTLRNWRANPPPGAAELGPEKEAELERILERLASALATSIFDKIDGAALNHAAVALGIVIDKLRLLKGEATEVTEVRGSDAKRELAERLARLAAERSEAPRAPN
jgi:hypothetical protein